MKAIVTSTVAHIWRYARLESELATAQRARRRVVERAKALFMAERKTTKPQAYRWLRSGAMNKDRRILTRLRPTASRTKIPKGCSND